MWLQPETIYRPLQRAAAPGPPRSAYGWVQHLSSLQTVDGYSLAS